MLWSGVATLSIGLALKVTMGWRVDEETEVTGIDLDEHGERAYDFAPAVFGGTRSPAGAVAAPAALETKEKVEAVSNQANQAVLPTGRICSCPSC